MERLITLRETDALPSVKNTRQSLCRVPHSAKSTRQNSGRQRGLCRVFFIGHSAKALPSADTRQRKNKKKPKKIEKNWKGCPSASTR